jgi:endonuclease/exonuclease/phosphatase (EEP) superfamily protein YafD
MKVKHTREAVRRKKLLRFLESDIPAWKDADHPELACGAAAWVRDLRQEGERKRFERRTRSIVTEIILPEQLRVFETREEALRIGP